tara:strand:+ start:943 stop:2808 length:1866 start_codon:yes stop_codon:yes gene_type:complete
MGGIAGVVNFQNRNVETRTVNDMLEMIIHRGPDKKGSYVDGTVGLCSTLINIHNFSENYTQPLISQDGEHILVFNGEIYNYKELKKEYLSGISFSGDSDAEVLLQMYIKYGEDFLKYLNGMFSFAIYDKRKGKIICARDRLGIKPFFYYLDTDQFLFASEIKPILSTGVKSIPDYQSIYDYLVHGYLFHTSNTFFKNIQTLSPSHYLSVDIRSGDMDNKLYWDLSGEASKISLKNEEEYLQEIESTLFDSIRLNLQTEKPIGISVSGGFDSCIVSAAVQKLANVGRKHSLYCYFGDEKGYNESPIAQQLADALSSPLYLFPLSHQKALELAQDIIYLEEQPYAGIPQIAKYNFYNSLRDEGVKVILSGAGGDTLGGESRVIFGGYIFDFIKKFGWERAYVELTSYMKREGINEIDNSPFLLQSLSSLFHGKVTVDGQSYSILEGLDKEFLINEQGHDFIFLKPFSDYSLNMQYQGAFQGKLLRIMHNDDKASSSCGIEMRAPLADHRLIEIIFSSPIEMRMRDGQQRYLMRQIAKKLLNFEGMDSPKVFHLDPQRYWFQTKLANWVAEIIHSKSFNERGIFNQKEVIKEFKAYKNRKNPPTSYHIWQCICTEMWFRAFIDQ